MFDRHQAEITVTQFTGNSLPVHQSMSVPWDFTLSHLVSQAANAISSHNCHRNVPLPSGASLWNGMFGRVEGQYTTALRGVIHSNKSASLDRVSYRFEELLSVNSSALTNWVVCLLIS